MIRFICTLCFVGYSLHLFAQFPPAAGQTGSTAIPAQSPNFVDWAQQATPALGWKNIADKKRGKVSTGTAQSALGPQDGLVLSLGDSGQVTLQFTAPLQDRPGYDFAVFENGFSDTFLELAFVEVSSDGQHFVRFPATSLTDTLTQVDPFGALQAENLHNLAGKYRAGFGTPFDLSELADSTALNLQHITHIRLIDVIGSIQAPYASRDAQGHKINDPWPTPFSSSGFDLDAVGVIHNTLTATHQPIPSSQRIFPNPVFRGQSFSVAQPQAKIQVFNAVGQLWWQGQTPAQTTTWPAGLYWVLINGQHGQWLHLR